MLRKAPPLSRASAIPTIDAARVWRPQDLGPKVPLSARSPQSRAARLVQAFLGFLGL